MNKNNKQFNNIPNLKDVTSESEIKDILNFSKKSSKDIVAHKLELENMQHDDNLNYITQSVYLGNK